MPKRDHCHCYSNHYYCQQHIQQSTTTDNDTYIELHIISSTGDHNHSIEEPQYVEIIDKIKETLEHVEDGGEDDNETINKNNDENDDNDVVDDDFNDNDNDNKNKTTMVVRTTTTTTNMRQMRGASDMKKTSLL
eukprot:15355889-Ditylum_brightwellii.AAC.1